MSELTRYFVNLGNDRIKEYCTGLRNEVKVRNDSLIDELNRQSESMICRIEAFEKECLEKFGDGVELRKELSKEILEIERHYAEAEEYLQSGPRAIVFNNQMLSFSNPDNEIKTSHSDHPRKRYSKKTCRLLVISLLKNLF